MKLLRQQTLNSNVLFLFGILFPGLILLYVLNDEKQIYYYDYSNYWVKTIEYQKFLINDGFDVFRKVYNSINTQQYNDFATLPLAVLGRVFGLEFRYFIFCTYLLYAIPGALLFGNLILRFSKNKNRSLLLVPILYLMFVPLLFPLRYGFIGTLGLVIIGIIFNLFFIRKYWEKKDLKTFVLIGIMLLLLLFTRRWFTFWVLSFFCINFLLLLVVGFRQKSIKPIINGGFNLTVAGLVCGGIMLIFFYPFFELTFLADYKDLYSGYRVRSIKGHWNSIVNTFGYINLFLIILGIVGYFMTKRYYEAIYFLLCFLTLSVFFVTFNDFGPQHYYIIIPFILLLILGTLFVENKKFKHVSIAILLIVFCSNFYINFMTNEIKTAYFFSTINGYKYDRPDYDVIASIMNDIEYNYEENRQYSYLIGNGGFLNYSLLQNIYLPQKVKATKGLLRSQNVDKRDDFPNDLFLATNVLVGEPALHHLRAEDQQVITYFNEQIMIGNMKDFYKKIKTYYLMDNQKVHLMKRIKIFDSAKMDEIRNHFKNQYPNYPNMYNVNPIVGQISSYKRGNAHGEISIFSDAILMHPGGTDSTKISLSILDSQKTLNFTASFANKDEFTKSWCNPDNDGEINLYIWGDDKLLNEYYVTHKEDINISVPLENIHELTLSVDKGRNFDYCDKFIIKNLEIKWKKEM
ncbi:MAG: hypothetical protein WDA08_07725 [Weeksellaceae bacterium]